MRYPDARILIFAKAAQPGYAKTRLIPVLGADGAARLQTRLAGQSIQRVLDSRLAPAQLWLAGSPDTADIPNARPLPAFNQQGGDLGERMAQAFTQVLSDASFAVLIGTDCPAMDGGYLREACEQLHQGKDVVLGPAEDGGYVLIGLRQPCPELFRDIDWGTERVLQQTRQRITELGLNCHQLPVLWDIDRPEDLARMRELGMGYPGHV